MQLGCTKNVFCALVGRVLSALALLAPSTLVGGHVIGVERRRMLANRPRARMDCADDSTGDAR